jgi:hypothetical protein
MERNDTRQEPSDLVLVLHPYAVSVDTGRTTVCHVCARVLKLREPAPTKSGYDDEMFANTSR